MAEKPLTKEQKRALKGINILYIFKGLFIGVQAALLMVLLNFILFMFNDMFFGKSDALGFIGGVLIAIGCMRNMRSLQDENEANRAEKIKKVIA